MLFKKSFLLTSAATFIALSADVQAQTSGGIDEIIVTATKKAESAQDIPIAITANSGDDLEDSQVASAIELQYLLPNVNISERLGAGVVAIRGIGFEVLTAGADSNVAVHSDGVYISRPQAVLTGFFDIERVELARGPQGTLYGRNATGGAVNIISRKPTDELEGYFKAGYGNYNDVSITGAISGPISENVRGRVAAKFDKRDGFGVNLFNNQEVDDLDTFALRGILDYTSNSGNFKAELIGDYFTEDDAAFPFKFGGPANPAITPRGLLLGGTAPDPSDIDNLRDISHDVQPVNRRDIWSLSATAEYDFGEVTLRSITGYRDTQTFLISDLDGTSFFIFPLTREEDAKQFSQEVQLFGNTEKLDWLVGAFYFNEDSRPVARDFTGVNTAPEAAPFPGSYGGVFDQRAELKTEAYAAFAQGTYDVTEDLAVVLGGRYSVETRDINESLLLPPLVNGSIGISQTASINFKSFTPRVGLNYKLGESTLLYGSWSRGFKSGGFAAGAVRPAFDEEKIESLEVGLKTTLADNRVQINISAFDYNYDDLQIGTVQGVSTVISNAAAASVRGMEFESKAILSDSFRVDFNLSLLDAKYTQFASTDPAFSALGVQDFSGNQLPSAADLTTYIGIEYETGIGNGDLSLRAEAAYTSEAFLTSFNRNPQFQNDYTTVNFFANYKTSDGRWEYGAYVRNATDETVKGATFVSSGLVGFVSQTFLLPPRRYGVNLTYNFGN